VPKRRVNYGPINPAESREIFIRFALVEGDFSTRAPFWRHNQELIASIHHLEAKARRRDILVDEEVLYAFYDRRIPAGIYSTPQFEQWLRKATRTDPKLLHLRPADLMQHEATGITPEHFPDRLQVGATALPLEYRFEPGESADGLTLIVPLPLINQVTAERLDWLVPGLLEARITALLRGLPKGLRTALVPVPDTAARLAGGLKAALAEGRAPVDRPLTQVLAERIAAEMGLRIPEDAWDRESIPAHLRMKVRLVDEAGRALALDEDPQRLKQRFGQAGQARFARIPDAELEREGITRWDFGDLPEQVEITRGGIRMRGFPALVDEGQNVAVRVLDAPEVAERAHRAGLRRLLTLTLGATLRPIRQSLKDLDRLRLLYAKAPAREPGRPAPEFPETKRPCAPKSGGQPSRPPSRSEPRPPDLSDELMALILDRTFLDDRPPIRTQTDFEARLAESHGRLQPTANEVTRLAAEILAAYQSLRQRLAAITQVNWQPTAQDLRDQIDALVFRGFFQQIPYVRLKQYPRYLKAAEQRLGKLAHAPGRDREQMAVMAELLTRWRERTAAARKAGREDARLDEIRWLLEELRVSLFAQTLGTAGPVSVKRIQARWRELGL